MQAQDTADAVPRSLWQRCPSNQIGTTRKWSVHRVVKLSRVRLGMSACRQSSLAFSRQIPPSPTSLHFHSDWFPPLSLTTHSIIRPIVKLCARIRVQARVWNWPGLRIFSNSTSIISFHYFSVVSSKCRSGSLLRCFSFFRHIANNTLWIIHSNARKHKPVWPIHSGLAETQDPYHFAAVEGFLAPSLPPSPPATPPSLQTRTCRVVSAFGSRRG